jgi:transposase InsO family protein
MPWKECSKEDERVEFVSLAKVEGANVRRLCERFGISRKTGHKWLRRFGSNESLTDRSRRPQHSPTRTARKMEQAVLGVRDRHPAWGGRKIAARLQNTGHQGVPAASTITEILRRHERLDETEAIKHRPYQRFERARPNDLWQMDFKGHFGLRDGTRCHALTVLDDHSRYALGLRACGNERRETVQTELIELFRRYGLPLTILLDNGAPWGTGDWHNRYTALVVWLLRLGIEVTQSRPVKLTNQFSVALIDDLALDLERRRHLAALNRKLLGQQRDSPHPFIIFQVRRDPGYILLNYFGR